MQNKLEKLKVLIIDDDKTILDIVNGVLENLGFKNVIITKSGQKAIELLAKQKFDFIITDWRMNDINGIEIVKFVRTSPESLNPVMPIIMLTGNSEAHEVLMARDAGVDNYLIKPFSAEQLAKRIRTIIENPREFVFSKKYTGPSRRYHNKPPPNGIERRRNRSQEIEEKK